MKKKLNQKFIQLHSFFWFLGGALLMFAIYLSAFRIDLTPPSEIMFNLQKLVVSSLPGGSGAVYLAVNKDGSGKVYVKEAEVDKLNVVTGEVSKLDVNSLSSDDLSAKKVSVYDNSGNVVFTVSGEKVGINTSTPAYDLDVNGDVRVMGNLVGGWYANKIYGGSYSMIFGYDSYITGGENVIIGGGSHRIDNGGVSSYGRNVIIGGWGNKIIGDNNIRDNVIVGGMYNEISGATKSVVMGYSGKLYNSSRTFMWNGSLNSHTVDGQDNSFIIYADNGVGINTSSPQYTLDVNGDIHATGFVKVGNTDASCDSNHYGTIKFSGDHFYGCNSAGRVQLDN